MPAQLSQHRLLRACLPDLLLILTTARGGWHDFSYALIHGREKGGEREIVIKSAPSLPRWWLLPYYKTTGRQQKTANSELCKLHFTQYVHCSMI